MNHTNLYKLLAAKLRRDPIEDMRARRENGESWRAIMIAYEMKGVSVTDVTLRAWFREAEEQAEQEAAVQ